MKIYLVGGAVRDTLLNIPIFERDWVVVGSTPQDMLSRGYKQVGKDFPVFLHPINHEEYALARTERKFGKGHAGFFFNASHEISLEEDLYRRDLTINAIACDEFGTFIDPYNGMRDIFLRKLRHISHAFCEDPLRVLRVARFAARFFYLGFSVDLETLLLMKKMRSELLCLSSERIWRETELALMTRDPHIFFKILKYCDVLSVLFPELDVLFEVPYISYSSDVSSNVGMHTLKVVSLVSKLSCSALVRFSALCHDFEQCCFSYLFAKYFRVEYSGLRIIDVFCRRLRIPASYKEFAKVVYKYCGLLQNAKNLASYEIIKFFNDIDIWHDPSKLENLLLVSEADMLAKVGYKNYFYVQKNFIWEAYRISCLISAKEIVDEGYQGKMISDILNVRRRNLLDKWKHFVF
ncbi:MAG: fused tRNA nucleotidyltransferase/2',3'-cyclic phosphodiesterase/2' nucleotidase and phosphatase [Candidatus Westeberhardia cardiocondylae]|nr:fused tRNA nucleotidyltransferase/2',3'-cyclic phosphodiesterase/2' nucleotidase and phosphatase [Candidatus Westeberhardia cardiocondylae]